jgi:hypothetical protein
MFSYDKYIDEQRKFYIEYSKKVERKQEEFKKHHLKIFDIEKGTLLDIKHSYIQNQKNDYLWFLFNQKLLEEEMIKSNEYEAIFLTLTLSSKFHKFHKKTKKYNSTYDKNCTIKKGYELLNKGHRDIYKNFKVKNKHIKMKFSKVIEFHHEFSCHLHSVLYVKKEYIQALISHIKRVIKNLELGKSEIKVVDSIEKSSAYILKYIIKEVKQENEEAFHLVNGWKKYNKIRMFTFSNKAISRYVFERVNRTLKVSKNLKGNPITKVLADCEIETKIVDEEENYEKIKKKGNLENAKYSVKIEKKRYKKHLELNLKSEDRNYLTKLLNDDEYLDNLAFKCSLYKFDKELVQKQIDEMKSLVASYLQAEEQEKVLSNLFIEVHKNLINIQQKKYKQSNTIFDKINELNKVEIEEYYSKIYNKCVESFDLLENKKSEIIENLKKFKKIDGGYKYLYQLKKFKIIDNKTKKVMYDKANYENLLDSSNKKLEKDLKKIYNFIVFKIISCYLKKGK